MKRLLITGIVVSVAVWLLQGPMTVAAMWLGMMMCLPVALFTAWVLNAFEKNRRTK